MKKHKFENIFCNRVAGTMLISVKNVIRYVHIHFYIHRYKYIYSDLACIKLIKDLVKYNLYNVLLL